MPSAAEAKSSGNSSTATIVVCLWLPNGSRCFQRALISKGGFDLLIMKGPSVIHAALGLTATTVEGN